MSSLSDRPLRWGIMGAGFICADFCIALSTLPKSEHIVVHVGARDVTRAQAFAERFSITKFSGSYEDVARDGNVDVIYIGTINTTHKQLGLLSLNHKKAVLCEKPVTMNSSELEEVLACAKKNNVFFMEAAWTRCLPLYKYVLSNLKDGKYGDPNVLQATFGVPIIDCERIWNPALGGSVIMDIGIYLLIVADMMFAGHKLKEMRACGHVEESTGVDRSVSITMTFEGNKIVQLLADGDHALPNECVLFCSKGKVKVAKPFWCSEKCIEENDDVEKNEVIFLHPVSTIKTNFDNSTALSYEASHVRDCLLAGQVQSEIVSHESSKRIMGYLDELRRQLGMRI